MAFSFPSRSQVRWRDYLSRLARGSSYSIAKGLGLPFVRSEVVRSGVHEMVFPVATYAPWRGDEDFQRIHGMIGDHTLVDVYRQHELWQLVGQLEHVPGALIEVGVWRGGTAALIAARARQVGIDAAVYLADTFTGVVKTSDEDPYYSGGEHSDTSEGVVRDLLEHRLGLTGIHLLTGIFPEETAGQVTEDAVRFCHIDVDAYASAKDVLDWVWPRLSLGGVVVFDDYGGAATSGVATLVDGERGRADALVLHNLNGHGIIVKRGGHV